MGSQDKYPDNCIGVSEAAMRIGVCVETVRRWIKSGKIKAYREGNRYLIPIPEIETHVNKMPRQISGQASGQDPKDEIIAALKEQNRILQDRVRELEKDKAYLKNDLSLQDLSEATGIPKHRISQLLNNELGKNFYEVLNEYRTNEAIRLFNDGKHLNFTLTYIAEMAGFNSRATFNRIFKKLLQNRTVTADDDLLGVEELDKGRTCIANKSSQLIKCRDSKPVPVLCGLLDYFKIQIVLFPLNIFAQG